MRFVPHRIYGLACYRQSLPIGWLKVNRIGIGEWCVMRITSEEKDKIVHYAKQYFGTDAKLYLFGSRADDAKKGGDIDLFLDSANDVDMQTQVEFLKALYRHVTPRKVDLVIKSPSKKDQLIFRVAKQEGILLC